jgi:hypothetical protein
MKKMLLLALAAISALLALPAFASANPGVHVVPKPEGAFSVHGGASTLTRTDGNSTTGTTTTGTGTFENTTTGTVKLTFHGVKALGFSCGSTREDHIENSGTVTATSLPFHLVTLDGGIPGILMTPGMTNHWARFKSGFGVISLVVLGSGVLGEITNPACGANSNTATLKFSGAAGVQTPLTMTGTKYTLESSINGGANTQSAMNAEAKITFAGGATPKLVCT